VTSPRGLSQGLLLARVWDHFYCYQRAFHLDSCKAAFELNLNFLTVETVGFQIVTILLLHPSKIIGQFAKKIPGWPWFE